MSSQLQKSIEENDRLVAELNRLEALLLTMDDHYRCENCRHVWHVDDLTRINDKLYCPECALCALEQDEINGQNDAADEYHWRHR